MDKTTIVDIEVIDLDAYEAAANCASGDQPYSD